ncbi:hypothetical protein [Actinoplanes sp. G11-F43]|uniref:hypothetical protein n=1 Tax=Actinoplanes sp. G11-F43 TaxID=3424130 RepID=UPI003D3537BF
MTFLTSAALAVSLAAVPIPPIAEKAAPAAGMRAKPATRCTVTNGLLNEISGLATDGGDGYVVMNDGADDPAGRRIFFLNSKCKIVKRVPYPTRPRDTEDLARGADGTLWVGDIGDNNRTRDTIGVWRLKPGGKSPKLFRMSYPDGAHDAEALLVGSDGVPIVVTKDPLSAGVYVPDGPLKDGATTPLRRAGDFSIPITATSNPFGFKGRLVVTGGAVSPDGRRLVLRTYADAFEFDVPEGQTDAAGLIETISAGTSRTIALPDEPQGEAITYSADGTELLTISEMTGGADRADLLGYPLGDREPIVAKETTEPAATETGARTATTPETRAVRTGEENEPATGVPTGALMAGGVLAVAATLIGLVTARRRRR